MSMYYLYNAGSSIYMPQSLDTAAEIGAWLHTSQLTSTTTLVIKSDGHVARNRMNKARH